ncbi:MAG: hypothetical protein NTY38_15795 [Acidobacteria bacterium]|nr:hypothetical protein [Acidobacteriota bacterium]
MNRWAAAGRTRDVEAQVACYAPRLDRFYGSRDVPREVVRKDRQHVLKQLGAVRRFDIWNVEITVTHPGNATAVLNKSWEFVGRAIYSGQVREQLSLRKQNGNWKIVSQHDLQVYRSRSS